MTERILNSPSFKYLRYKEVNVLVLFSPSSLDFLVRQEKRVRTSKII